MLGEISAAFASVRAIKEITAGLIAARDANKLDAAVAEMNERLLDAQGALFKAQEQMVAQAERLRAVEGELQALRNWEAEKARYDLKGLANGRLVYVSKQESLRQGEPEHMICPQCFEKARKSVLQKENFLIGGGERLVCFACDFHIYTVGAQHPGHPPHGSRRK